MSPPASRPVVGLDDVHAAAAQRGDVVDDGRVLPHLGVHRRADHDRRPRGEQHVGQQVGRQPGGVRAEQPGRGRGDEHQVGRLAEPGVRDRRRASSHRLVCTGSLASADSVVRPRKCSAPFVITGTTWAPASTSRRQTSTAL